MIQRELDQLPEHLVPGEDLIIIAEATVGLKAGLLAITNRRLLFFNSGTKKEIFIEHKYDEINSVKCQSIFSCAIVVNLSGKNRKFTEISPRKRRSEIIDYINEKIKGELALKDVATG